MDLATYQKQHLPLVEAKMKEFLQNHTNQPELLAAMNYSIEAGGKRLRPLLLLLTTEFCGGKLTDGHYEIAAALEMIHTYSLIHDDLPAMDNDDLRRGKPTNHKVYGEALAILAGDGLLTAAFQLVALSAVEDAVVKNKLVALLGAASGTAGMVAGQVADIEGESRSFNLAELKSVHARKTGALVVFATVAGSLLGDAPEQVQNYLQIFGEHFGVAFQIRDDLLDVVGDEKEIGKKTGMDAQLHKSTYPALLGVAGAQEALTQEIQLADEALNQAAQLLPSSDAQLLKELLQQLKKF